MKPTSVILLLPRFVDVLWTAGAVDRLHVSYADLRSTHGHEVGSWPADGVLGEFCQRLADRGSKQKGAHHLVESSYISVEAGVGVNLLPVDQISFSWTDLRKKKKKILSSIFHFIFCMPNRQRLWKFLQWRQCRRWWQLPACRGWWCLVLWGTWCSGHRNKSPLNTAWTLWSEWWKAAMLKRKQKNCQSVKFS